MMGARETIQAIFLAVTRCPCCGAGYGAPCRDGKMSLFELPSRSPTYTAVVHGERILAAPLFNSFVNAVVAPHYWYWLTPLHHKKSTYPFRIIAPGSPLDCHFNLYSNDIRRTYDYHNFCERMKVIW